MGLDIIASIFLASFIASVAVVAIELIEDGPPEWWYTQEKKDSE